MTKLQAPQRLESRPHYLDPTKTSNHSFTFRNAIQNIAEKFIQKNSSLTIHPNNSFNLPEAFKKPFQLIRKIFSASTLADGKPNFPFYQEYSYGITTQQKVEETDFSDLFEKTCENQQGFFEIVTPQDKNKSLVIKLKDALQEKDSISITNTLSIVNIRKAEEPSKTIGQRNWTITVKNSEEDIEIDIPLTEVIIQQPSVSLKKTHATYTHFDLEQASAAFDSHLARINWAYRDSVTQPAILSQANAKIPEKLIVYKEIQSLIDNNLFQPEESAFKVEASKLIQQLGFKGSHLTLIKSLHKYYQERNPDSAEVMMRKNRRHTPLFSTETNTTPDSANQTDIPNQLDKAQTVVSQTQNLELSLRGKSPAARPLHGGPMYREPAKTMQCAVNSINTFFQQNIVSPAALVKGLVQARSEILGMLEDSLSGLWHPKLVVAMLEGKPCTISKQEFLGNSPEVIPQKDALYNQSPKAQWNTLLCEIEPLGSNKGPGDAEHQDEFEQLQSLTINPSDWLSALNGASIDTLENTIQTILATGKNDSTWEHYPEEVSLYHLTEQRVDQRALSHEQAVDAFISQLEVSKLQYAEQGKDFPIIVMEGLRDSGLNHYFTAAYNGKTQQWVNLSANGTSIQGTQESNTLLADTSNLRNALISHKIGKVICPTLHTHPFRA